MSNRKMPDKEVLMKLVADGLSYIEIAELYGATPDTVSSTISRLGIKSSVRRYTYTQADRAAPNWFDEYFWQRTWPEPNTGCWIWSGGTSDDGYPWAAYRKKKVRAHRLSYEHLIGPIPEGLTIDHLCRFILCVNPDHMEPVPTGVNTLRGQTITGNYSRRSVCKYGHTFDAWRKCARTGKIYRRCRTCTRLSKSRWKQERQSLLAVIPMNDRVNELLPFHTPLTSEDISRLSE